MNKLIYSALPLALFVSIASAQTATPTQASIQTPIQPKANKTVRKAVPVAPLSIPPAAVKQPNGDYRYVDAKGTAWIYHNTPFGLSRATEASVQANTATAQAASTVSSGESVKPAQDRDEKVTAIAKGDSIEFARPTPFGVTRWSKSKTDLTADEQKIWDREQAKRNQ